MNASLKILHVITGLGTGGAETALCRLIESLAPPHYRHFVVALNAAGANNSLRARVLAAGAEVAVLGMTPSAPNPFALLKLRRIVRTWMPDVVHGWMYHGNLAAALASGPVPLVWGIRQTLGGSSREKFLTNLVIRAGGWIGAKPKAIVYNAAVSAGQHEALGYPAAKRRIIANGIDAQEFRPDPQARRAVRAELGIGESQFVLGHFARFHPVKDHATAMRAAAGFIADWPEAVFLLAGEGMSGDNALLAELIGSHGVQGHMRLLGRRSDMARLSAAIDLGFSSSAWGEGFSNAIAESMASGAPCVSTDVGAAREIIGEAGIVVPPRDPAALGNAWRTIAGMEAGARQNLSRRARERIETHFSLEACARAYAGLYREFARVAHAPQ